MRYTNAIMHLYYLALSGPMDDEKWSLMERRGLLTKEEIEALQLQGSPGVVVYSWAISAMHSAPAASKDSSLAERVFAELIQVLEAQLGGTRGLAAKQIAYTIYQVPSIYFHIVYVAVNVRLACGVYDSR